MGRYDYITPRPSHVLQKKEIKKLPRHKPPKRNTKYKHVITVTREETSSGKLLQITVWKMEDKPKIVFIAYIDREIALDATYFPSSRSWSSATFEFNLCSSLHCWSKAEQEKIYFDKASTAEITAYTGDKFTYPLDQLMAMFVENRSAAYFRKHENLQKRYEAILSQRKPLPKDFYSWCDRHVFDNDRYIVYRREKKEIHGYCIGCQTGFIIPAEKGMRPGAVVKCSNCHRAAKLLSPGMRSSKDFFALRYVTLLNRISDGLLVRCIPVERRFEIDSIFYSGTSGDRVLAETAEYFIPFVGNQDIDIEYVSGAYGYAWRPAKAPTCMYTPQSRPGVLYSRNIKNELENTPWKYSALECLSKSRYKWDGENISNYLYKTTLDPLIERLMKVGLIRLGIEQAGHYGGIHRWSEKKDCKLHTYLGVSRSDLPVMARLDVSAEEARLYALAVRSGFQNVGNVIKKLRTLVDGGRITSSIVDNFNTLRNQFGAEKVRHIMLVYIPGQEDEKKYNYTLLDYVDYLGQCELLGIDLSDTSNLYPKNLSERHTALSAMIKAKKDKEINTGIKRQWNKKHKLFDFPQSQKHMGSKFCVKYAPSQEAIIAEGAAMRHCVGTYTEKVAKGQTNILFIRSTAEPDTPLATAEVKDDGQVIQIRAARNAPPTEEVMKFWETYKKKVLSKLRQANLKQAN